MYRYTTLAAGSFYVLFGVVGFIPPLHENWPADEPMMTVRNGRGFLFGTFPNNFALSLLHLLIGAWGLFAARRSRTSWLYIRAMAVVFGVLAVAGLLPVTTSLAGVVPTFGATAALHVVTAALLLSVVLVGKVKGPPHAAARQERPTQNEVISAASLAGVPVHIFLASFPLAFLLGAVGTDLAHWWTTLDWYAEYNGFWATASVWLIGAGVVSGVLASIVGLVDLWALKVTRRRRMMWIHVIGSTAATGLAAVNLAIRYVDHAARIIPYGILLSLLTSGLLVYCGWYAGHVIHRELIGASGRDRARLEMQQAARSVSIAAERTSRPS